MAEISLKYLNHFRDRHGVERWYFRRNDKRTRLPGAPGSAEFMEEYNKLLQDSEAAPRPKPTARATEGTLAALAAKYFASPNFLRLKPHTQANYRSVIGRFLVEHGHRPAKTMTRTDIDGLIGSMADRPGAAETMLKRLRTLCRYGVEIGDLERDPTAGAKGFKQGEHHTWTEAEIEQFEARWPIGTKQRLVFAALLYTAQRVSDVAVMMRPRLGDTIPVKQSKTGAVMELSVHPEFMEVIEATPLKHAALIVTAYGKPHTAAGLGHYMAKAIEKAGLPERCVSHGLRKAAARRLAEVGCTANEIMSVTGHSSLSEVQRYTKAAEQVKLNRGALEKQVRNR